MKGKLFENWNRLCHFVLKQCYLNILWILFTLLGLGLFGIGPATVAMLAVQRQWVRGNEDLKIFRFFWKEYKENFKEATIFGLIYLIAGIVLATNIIVLSNFFAKVFYSLIAVFYLISLLYIGPVLVHFDAKGIRSKIKSSLILGFSYLQYTLILVVLLVFVYTLAFQNHGILIFFGASIGGYLVMRIANMVVTLAEIQVNELKEANKKEATLRKTAN